MIIPKIFRQTFQNRKKADTSTRVCRSYFSSDCLYMLLTHKVLPRPDQSKTHSFKVQKEEEDEERNMKTKNKKTQ